MATFADVTESVAAFVPETTEGTTPTPPAFQKILLTTFPTLNPQMQFSGDNSIQEGGNVVEHVYGGYSLPQSYQGLFRYGVADALLAGALRSSFSSDVMVNGTSDSSFTTETKIAMPDNSSRYERGTGMKVGTFGITIPASGGITFQADMMGREHVPDSAIVAGATYIDPVAGPVFSSRGGGVNLVTLGGDDYCMISGSLNFSNNPRERTCSGKEYTHSVAHGQFGSTFQTELYFPNVTMRDRFLSKADTDAVITLGGDAGSQYRFTALGARLTQGNLTSGDVNSDFTQSFTISPKLASSIGGMVQVERATLS